MRLLMAAGRADALAMVQAKLTNAEGEAQAAIEDANANQIFAQQMSGSGVYHWDSTRILIDLKR